LVGLFRLLISRSYKSVPDCSVSNIRSKREGGFKFLQPTRSCAKLIHLVILQSLGDTTFFKRPLQTDDIHLVMLESLGDATFFKRAVQADIQKHRHTDTQTHRAYKWLQVPPFNLTVNVGNDNSYIQTWIYGPIPINQNTFIHYFDSYNILR